MEIVPERHELEYFNRKISQVYVGDVQEARSQQSTLRQYGARCVRFQLVIILRYGLFFL